ncbi:MAG: DUF4493 domain-containing protein [Muribaculaceae bacterium]|nr:DUF4493 domain-containing protein [Muribaculaceae bacterium]
MNRLTKGFLLCGALFGMLSCTNEDGFRNGGADGKIILDLSSDGRVLTGTRADDTKVSVVPEPSEFTISFEKEDGSLSKKYVNVDAFNRETGFPIGTYTISATYGNIENEGFELPFFSATQNVLVEAGNENHVSLNATLANAMVSIRYTDEFKNNFAAYASSAKSESSDDSKWIAFTQNEDRPAYMKPEEITVRLSMTNAQGKQVEVEPLKFIAEARHHYIATFGVKDQGGTGSIALDVQITEEVESEFVDISLGDDLFNAPAPSVKAYDFPASMTYEEFEGFIANGDPRVDVLAYGGLREVNLSVESANSLAFGNTVQLVNADPAVQSQVESTGLEAVGFFRNPDKAGVIKFKNFFSKLPKGTYKVTIDAVDKRTLVSEEKVEFTVNVKATEIKLSVKEFPEFMGEEMTVNVITNQPDIKDRVRFKVADDNENWVDAKIISDPVSVRTRSNDEYSFDFRLAIPAPHRDTIKVQLFYGEEASPKATIQDKGVIFPEYSVEVDAFANKALIKVTPKDPAKFDVVTKNFKLLVDGSERPLNVYDAAAGIYELPGLLPNMDYSGYESCLSYTSNPLQAVPGFHTESATDITNGDFGASTQTINFSNIQVGGVWKVAATEYRTKSSIVRSTPNGWANLNELTCWEGSNPKNTWFMVPTTYSDNGEVVLVSAGYNHNGTIPATTSAKADKYYCYNTPSEDNLKKVAGELFLGEYSFNGTENRKDGITWSSRPEYVSFKYKYEPINNEQAEAYIKIFDAAGEMIGSNTVLISAGSDNNMIMPVRNYKFGKKAARIELGFRSTKHGVTPAIRIPSGDEMDEGWKWTTFTQSNSKPLEANSYHSVALGSKLTIDNVKLEYGSSLQANAKRRVVTKKSVVRKK